MLANLELQFLSPYMKTEAGTTLEAKDQKLSLHMHAIGMQWL